VHTAPTRRRWTGSVGQHAVQLPPRPYVELGENFAQVIFHGAGADEQPRADLGVGVPVAGHPRDLGFLRGQNLAVSGNGALRLVSPVAPSSRRARSAKPSMPIASNMSWARRSSLRASVCRRSRRSHSP
jgi:hypothetical protein